jgi:prepilin-type N-terminal cleavage/methylation domain-containing protein
MISNNSGKTDKRHSLQIGSRGFSLIEIAFVLVIIGLLVGGGVPIMTTLVRRKAHNEILAYCGQVKESLIAYAHINGRFPWASSSEDGTADDGVARGYLPYNDLKVAPVDIYRRVLKYEVNDELVSDRNATCNAVVQGLSSRPVIVDADGGTGASFSVAAILVSAGPMDADSDGDVFDAVTGACQGDNTDGTPNYIRYPVVDDFDDMVMYITETEMFNALNCGQATIWTVTVTNDSAREIFIHNVTYPTKLICVGRIESGGSCRYRVEEGEAIELRDDISYSAGDHVNSIPINTPLVIMNDETLVVNN